MNQVSLRFSDRAEAGRQLGDRLTTMELEAPVVYALPRGGVPVAVEVARLLKAPLDLIFVRKMGVPGSPEVALGAIVDGENPQTVINKEIQRRSQADADYLDKARARALQELERRRSRYLGDRAQVSAKDKTAVIVDDGLATGATMKAALLAAKQEGAKKVWIAVPVAPAEVAKEFENLVDKVVCLNPAQPFFGVGAFYDDFHQLSDEETISLLREG